MIETIVKLYLSGAFGALVGYVTAALMFAAREDK